MFTIFLECEPRIHNSLTTHPKAWIATPYGWGGGDLPNFGNLNRYQIDQNTVRIISLVKKKVLAFRRKLMKLTQIVIVANYNKTFIRKALVSYKTANLHCLNKLHWLTVNYIDNQSCSLMNLYCKKPDERSCEKLITMTSILLQVVNYDDNDYDLQRTNT